MNPILNLSDKVRYLSILAFSLVLLVEDQNVDVFAEGLFIAATKSFTQENNLAISENGLLPYQLCGSNESNLGAGIAFSSFFHDGVEQLIAVTASSSWGNDARLPRIEFLAFFRPNDPSKWTCYGCEIIPRGGPLINPNITCRVLRPRSQSRPGYFSVPALESLKRFDDGSVHVVNIMCPSLERDLTPTGRTTMEIFIGEKGTRTFSFDLCYIHVTSVRRASLCTEPLVSISNTDSNSLAFWRGITNVWPNGYQNHLLLDSFLKYHINVLGLHVTINTYFPDEFDSYIQRYLGPNFAYRPGWNLPGLGTSNNHLNYEIFSVATCQWEHRLDSQWVIAISAPDNFVFPRNFGDSLDNVLDRLDPEVYSGVEIPMMLSHSRLKTVDEIKNVLQRWRVLDNIDEPYYHHRSIPLYNPRHSTHAIVHWNYARTEEFKANLVGLDVIEKLSLSVVHLMALTRPGLNRPNSEERGDLQPWFDELGRRLGEELHNSA